MSEEFEGLEEAFEEGRKRLFKKPKTTTSLIAELGMEYQDPKNWRYEGVTELPEGGVFEHYQHIRDKSAHRYVRKS